jgi:hypothetical protein
MFQRIAHNYAKNGYYPTDSETTQRIINALQPSEQGFMRIIDPCCGEGVILAECKQSLGVDRTVSYGIEYNEERAYEGKKLLDYCIHSDINDCVVGLRQFGFMLLNPPYGSTVANKSDLSDKSQRLEKVFYRRAIGFLQYDGVMALIIPKYCLDKQFAGWITRHLYEVNIFEAPEQQFKQIVILGRKQRSSNTTDKSLREKLTAIGVGDLQAGEFPEQWQDEPYTVPAAQPHQGITFYSVKIDAQQLGEVIEHQPCLWARMGQLFHYGQREHRRPLRDLSSWHLALALAAGQVSGVVRSKDGKVYVIRGYTFKDKTTKEEVITNTKGEVIGTKRILTDRFVPTIRALDFTLGSETFGDSLVIR